jgi:phenylacetate-coenzyme A ligase PaaK-like adenylate-forming protein
LLAPRKILIRAGLSCGTDRPVFCIAITDNQRLQDGLFVDPTDTCGVSLLLIVNGNVPESVARAVDFIRTYQPVCIASKPSVLELLTQAWEESATSLGPSHIISSGSHLREDLRDRLARLTRGRVIGAYGLTECGLIASECSAGRLHVRHEFGVRRSAARRRGRDPFSPGGRGEVGREQPCKTAHCPCCATAPVTSAHWRPRNVLCGVHGPIIEALDGRKVYCFVLPSGRLFPPTYFNDMFTRFPQLIEFQLTQTSGRHFAVDIELKDGRGHR